MNRRTFLRAGVAGGLAGVAGCLDAFETESIWAGGPIVEDRPDAVYLPASSEEMGSYGTQELDDGTRLSLHYTYPHRFWTVTGDSGNRVDVADGDVAHLMTAVWDPVTEIVLPRRPRATITRDGEPIEQYRLWSMLAQRMGYHFGNNVAIDDDGSYEVRVDLDPLNVRAAGDFDGRFQDATSTTFEIDYESSDVLGLEIDTVAEERRGERTAMEPMDGMGPPPGRVPLVDELPGRPLGSGRSGDAVVAGTLLESPPTGVGGGGPYLAVSPRTPYNRIALPGGSLTAVLGESEHDLVETIDHRLGHHYGTALDAAFDRDPTIRVDAPPQVARHDGYETAFFEMEPVELSQ